MPMSPKDEIARYLTSGEHDGLYAVWSGDSFIARARNGNQALRQALIAAVNNRALPAKTPDELVGLDVAAFAREKVGPMVRGLFPAHERPAVLEMLSRSIVFLTPGNIEGALNKTPFVGTAWKLANLYLLSLGAEPLSNNAPEIVGLSEGTTCYVSITYFHRKGRFEDFVVHEAAHVFHNCKRETIGLSKRRGREWLLDIDFRKREMFAYACETYSCIVELGNTMVARRRLLEDVENEQMPPDESFDAKDYIQALRDAIDTRNGWKRILQSCIAPARRRSGSERSKRSCQLRQ
jgi:hypothetical protein